MKSHRLLREIGANTLMLLCRVTAIACSRSLAVQSFLISLELITSVAVVVAIPVLYSSMSIVFDSIVVPIIYQGHLQVR